MKLESDTKHITVLLQFDGTIYQLKLQKCIYILTIFDFISLCYKKSIINKSKHRRYDI